MYVYILTRYVNVNRQIHSYVCIYIYICHVNLNNIYIYRGNRSENLLNLFPEIETASKRSLHLGTGACAVSAGFRAL